MNTIKCARTNTVLSFSSLTWIFYIAKSIRLICQLKIYLAFNFMLQMRLQKLYKLRNLLQSSQFVNDKDAIVNQLPGL